MIVQHVNRSGRRHPKSGPDLVGRDPVVTVHQLDVVFFEITSQPANRGRIQRPAPAKEVDPDLSEHLLEKIARHTGSHEQVGIAAGLCEGLGETRGDVLETAPPERVHYLGNACHSLPRPARGLRDMALHRPPGRSPLARARRISFRIASALPSHGPSLPGEEATQSIGSRPQPAARRAPPPGDRYTRRDANPRHASKTRGRFNFG